MNSSNGRSLPVDRIGLALRSRLLRAEDRAILLADLRGSGQAADIHSINCGGHGRLWHKSATAEEDWEKFTLPYYPASWKLDVPLEDVSTVQVFQIAGCNYRCWFCYVDYHLLQATPCRAAYLSCEAVIGLLRKEPQIPRVIRLSGGQPDLVPEWVPWMMRALIEAGLDRQTYLWLDDNLSNDFAWRFLRDEDWDLMLGYRNFGRVGCLKGYDPDSFHFNTRAPAEHFARQIEVLRRLVATGLDVYVYLVLTSRDLSGIGGKIERLLDQLQTIDPQLPLRVSPIKISPHTPTVARMNSDQRMALAQRQFQALDVWRESMAKRFPADSISMPSSTYVQDRERKQVSGLPTGVPPVVV